MLYQNVDVSENQIFLPLGRKYVKYESNKCGLMYLNEQYQFNYRNHKEL
jgi:hypothetical protein